MPYIKIKAVLPYEENRNIRWGLRWEKESSEISKDNKNISLYIWESFVHCCIYVHVLDCVCPYVAIDWHVIWLYLNVQVVQYACCYHRNCYFSHYALWGHSEWMLPLYPAVPYAHEAVLPTCLLYLSIYFHLFVGIWLHSGIRALHFVSNVFLLFNLQRCA